MSCQVSSCSVLNHGCMGVLLELGFYKACVTMDYSFGRWVVETETPEYFRAFVINTWTHSHDPIKPCSSASQWAMIIVLRGCQPESMSFWNVKMQDSILNLPIFGLSAWFAPYQPSCQVSFQPYLRIIQPFICRVAYNQPYCGSEFIDIGFTILHSNPTMHAKCWSNLISTLQFAKIHIFSPF